MFTGYSVSFHRLYCIMIDALLRQADSRYRCAACNSNFHRKDHYNLHLATALHQRMLTKKNPTPPGALPNEFNPNNQCALCNTTYKKRKLYRRHLKTIHKMELTVCRPTPYPKITPNPNNARNHCGSCNWTYSLRNNYRFHLKEVHRMLTKAAKNNAQSKDYARYE